MGDTCTCISHPALSDDDVEHRQGYRSHGF